MKRVRIIAGLPSDGSLRFLVLTEWGLALNSLQVDDLANPAFLAQVPLAPAPRSDAIDQQLRLRGVQVLHGQWAGLPPGARLRIFALDSTREVLAHCDLEVPPDALPSQGLCFAVASCFYKDFHMGATYRAALDAKPLGPNSFKLLIGDNLYLDTAHSEPGLDTGPIETVYRYLDYWWNDAYGEVLSHLPTLFTFDDHELWNNYPEKVKWLSRTRGRLRQGYQDAGLECLQTFQSALNPPPVIGRASERSFATRIAGVPFFFLDVRTNRELRDGDASMMATTESLDALRVWATTLPLPGILVFGQPLVQGYGSEFDWQPPDFGRQYAELWRIIETSNRDLLLLSGDVHHSRVLELAVGQRRVLEVVTSPASHIPSISSVISGSFGSQARGEIKFPSRVPLRTPQPLQVAPTVNRYLAGTDVPNTIAQLRLSLHADGGLAVGLALLDLSGTSPGTIAASASAERDGEAVDPVWTYNAIQQLTILH